MMHIAGFFYWHAVKRNPDNAPALTNLGAALIDCKAFVGAQHVLSSAIAINPNDPHGCHHLGHIYCGCQMFAEAITCLERSKRTHAEDGSKVESLREFMEAFDNQKLADFVDGHKRLDSPYDLAVLLMKLGRYAQGVDVLSNSSVWRENAMAACCFGQCLMMLGRFDEALPKLEIATATLLPARILSAWCLLKLRKFPEVIAYSNDALRTTPLHLHSEFLFFAAEASRQMGDLDLEQRIVDLLFHWELWLREKQKLGL